MNDCHLNVSPVTILDSDSEGQGHRLRTFMLQFYVKVSRTLLFLNSVIYLFHVWHDD